jgi:hypothetical protein
MMRRDLIACNDDKLIGSRRVGDRKSEVGIVNDLMGL